MADSTFDLGTSKSVPLTVVQTDSAGAITTNPVGWTVNDETLVVLTDDGAGGTVAARADAASAGSVVVTATVTNADGSTASGTITLSLSAQGGGIGGGNTTGVEIVAGIPS